MAVKASAGVKEDASDCPRSWRRVRLRLPTARGSCTWVSTFLLASAAPATRSASVVASGGGRGAGVVELLRAVKPCAASLDGGGWWVEEKMLVPGCTDGLEEVEEVETLWLEGMCPWVSSGGSSALMSSAAVARVKSSEGAKSSRGSAASPWIDGPRRDTPVSGGRGLECARGLDILAAGVCHCG